MAYESGTATDYKDLLSKLHTFLTTNADLVAASQNWTAMRWDTSGSEYELIVRGPGLAGTDEIYVGVKTYSDEASDYYNWRLQGFSGYSASAEFDSQPGAITTYPPCLALHDAAMSYWFVADGRRFVVVAKVSTVFEAAYLGFLMPYGLPSQYPYPLCVGGSITGESGQRWSTQNVTHRHFADPGAVYGQASDEYRCYSTFRLRHGNWLSVRNRYGSETRARFTREVWPCGDAPIRHHWDIMRTNIDGTSPLFPLIVYQEIYEKQVFGELAGCFAVPGFGLAAEDIITVETVDYLVIQNVYRSSYIDYWALRLE